MEKITCLMYVQQVLVDRNSKHVCLFSFSETTNFQTLRSVVEDFSQILVGLHEVVIEHTVPVNQRSLPFYILTSCVLCKRFSIYLIAITTRILIFAVSYLTTKALTGICVLLRVVWRM